MKVDQKLVDAAISLVKARYGFKPGEGAAAVYTQDGRILTSTAPEVVNDTVSLCHETGAICEAYKLGAIITATVCVSQDEQGRFHILTPCGVCQERLFFWGATVEAAVPDPLDSTRWQSRTLGELQPHYWRKPFLK